MSICLMQTSILYWFGNSENRIAPVCNYFELNQTKWMKGFQNMTSI